MAISYPLSLPTTVGIASIEFSSNNAVAVSQSPFTYKQQIHTYAGQMLSASVSIPPLRKEFIEPWVSFLLSLRGQAGTFLMGDPNNVTPRGLAATFPATPVVSSVSGGTISITGGSNNKTGWLKAGDYIQLGSGSSSTLHKVLVDVNTASNGSATLEVWPYPRGTVASGSAITVSNTKGLFRLATNQQSWSINESSAYGLSFDCIEAI